ncbi:hypothetical protein KAR91_36130 [Candidatus Pacearchaeota archaeon]|nr:hypothetical protein [Candidatus Pacearchaeota archaeon]
MRTWYFKDGEPTLDSLGNIKIIEGLESLAENEDQRLKLFFGKYFMDTTQGVPYLEEILKKPVDPDLAASVLNAEVLKEPEVTNIKNIIAGLDRNTRVFSYSVIVESIFGETEVGI